MVHQRFEMLPNPGATGSQSKEKNRYTFAARGHASICWIKESSDCPMQQRVVHLHTRGVAQESPAPTDRRSSAGSGWFGPRAAAQRRTTARRNADSPQQLQHRSPAVARRVNSSVPASRGRAAPTTDSGAKDGPATRCETSFIRNISWHSFLNYTGCSSALHARFCDHGNLVPD